MAADPSIFNSVLQWLQGSELFDDAPDLSESDRKQLSTTLGETLQIDRSLRAEHLRSISEHDPSLGDTVHRILQLFGSIDDSLMPQEPARVTLDRIGPYRLTGVLGQGGMGKVHLAERMDGEIHLDVAIKIIKMGLDHPTVQQRFQSERQILASFNHPHIAKLLDAGTTPDGRAFLVMELIDGLPIDAYCETNNLSLKERIELLRKVCSAVAYAHRNLVVHRDLKPSNILVTPEGEPKLLDFGIAKLLDPDAFSLAPHEPTVSAMRPMTPSFASPEQILGQPITTATDVYALGILLYRLLTGRLPFPQNPAAASRRLSESPPRPSEAADQDSKASSELDPAEWPEAVISPHLLRGDLDSIVLKAVRPEPEQRYADVAALSEDLRAFLSDEPVSARRETPIYMLTKFLQRYKLPVSITALAILLLSTAVVQLFLQGKTIRQERDRVQAESSRVELTRDFLADLLRAADATTRTEGGMTLEDLLNDGLDRLNRGAVPDPVVAADLLAVIGDSFTGLDALKLADQSYQTAFDQLQTVDDGTLDPMRIRMLLRGAVAGLRRGAAQSAFGQVETALAFESLADHPSLFAEARLLRTDLYHLAGEDLRFLQSQNQVLEEHFEHLVELPSALTSSMVHRTQLLIVLGRLDEAISQSHLVETLIDRWQTEDTMEAIAIRLTSGLAWIVAGNLDAAAAIFEDVSPSLNSMHHSHQHWSVVYHFWQTKLLIEQQRYEEAAIEIRKARIETRKLTDFGPDEPRSGFFTAYALFFSALLDHRVGDSDSARSQADAAAEEMLRFPPGTFQFSLMRSVPILSLALAGRQDEAQPLFDTYIEDGFREPDVLALAEELGLTDGNIPAAPDMPVELPESFTRAVRALDADRAAH